MREDLWTDEELIVVCHIYRIKDMRISDKIRLAVLETGRSEGSIKKRFGNYQYFETGENGLSNGGRKAQEIWERFCSDREEMDLKAQEILESGMVGSSSNSNSEEAMMLSCPEGFYTEYMTKHRKNQNRLRELTL